MSIQWYALRSKPNKEDALWREINMRGLEVYYPQLRVRPVNPRARKLRPYFPGYLFVHIDLVGVGFSTLSWMPYSRGLVSFGSDPSPIAEELIQTIRQRVERVNDAGGELFDGLKPGEAVVIQDGPFAGYEAIFDTRLPGRDRVRVLLKLLSHLQPPLELPARQIQRKQRR